MVPFLVVFPVVGENLILEPKNDSMRLAKRCNVLQFPESMSIFYSIFIHLWKSEELRIPRTVDVHLPGCHHIQQRSDICNVFLT